MKRWIKNGKSLTFLKFLMEIRTLHSPSWMGEPTTIFGHEPTWLNITILNGKQLNLLLENNKDNLLSTSDRTQFWNAGNLGTTTLFSSLVFLLQTSDHPNSWKLSLVLFFSSLFLQLHDHLNLNIRPKLLSTLAPCFCFYNIWPFEYLTKQKHNTHTLIWFCLLVLCDWNER